MSVSLRRGFVCGIIVAKMRKNASRGGSMTKRSLLFLCVVLLAAVSATGQPRVGHLWPSSGVNEETATVHVYGNNFAMAPPSIYLIRSGSPDINAATVDVVSQRYLTCTFDLAGSLAGLYGLVMSNVLGADTLPGCFTVYSSCALPLVWQASVVGFGSTYINGVAVGDGDGDGFAEVYGASGDDSLYSFSWGGSTWAKTSLGAASDLMYRAAIGDGDEDGKIEVYGSSGDSALYQFKWNGSDWVKTTVGSGGWHMYGVAVGDGDNDARREVYGANGDRMLYQFEWNGANWVKTTIGSGGGFMYAAAVGDGNGDMQMEVYAANVDSNTYQFKFDGMSWVRTVAARGSSFMLGVAVGDGDSDGEIEVYSANQDGNIYRSKWTGSWDVTVVGSCASGMLGVALGDGDSDGEAEVYGASLDDSIYQFRWDGMNWIKSVVGSGTSDMSGLAVGDGNNDGRMEVYGANWDNNIYQFKHQCMPDIEVSDTSHDFGLVPVGDSLDWDYLVIRNVGNAPLVVNSISSDNPVFVVLPPALPCTIPAGDSSLVTVRFKPQSLGLVSGTVTIASDDPDESPLPVSVSGEGGAPGVEETRTRTGFYFEVKKNPGRDEVIFSILLPEEASVELRIYDVAGRLIDTPASGMKGPGVSEISWSPRAGSGVFFYRFDCPLEKRFGKLVFAR